MRFSKEDKFAVAVLLINVVVLICAAKLKLKCLGGIVVILLGIGNALLSKHVFSEKPYKPVSKILGYGYCVLGLLITVVGAVADIEAEIASWL